jgi:DNA polymerase III alpha subunit
VRRHLSQEAASYLHPALEPILRETYGVILYQEQVLRIAHEVSGFSLGEADMLRRAMSKKSEREMARLREQFVNGAKTTSGIDADTAGQIWELMAAFAGYGFPKAHAAGYASVAYRMTYLKTHFPAQFMAARLAVWGGYYPPRVYISEARHLGLAVKPPHINHSGEAFTPDESDPRVLWMGLGQVRDLTRATTQAIIAQRPFVSLEDLLTRAQPQHVEAVNLIKAGALDGLGTPEAMLASLDQASWRGRHTAQMSLSLAAPASEVSRPSLDTRAAWELEILGMPVSVHPLQLVEKELSHRGVTRSGELDTHNGQDVTVAGIRLAAHHFSSQQQESMLLVDMEDEAGVYQVLWSGKTLRDYRPVLSGRQPMLIHGRVRTDRQGQTLVVGHDVTLIAGLEHGPIYS